MITKEDAMTYHEFYHVHLQNSDNTPLRCRANGKCKTWITRPNDFQLPVKYGLKTCFYITPQNAHEWTHEEELMTKKEDEVLTNLAKALNEEHWLTLLALSDRLEELGDSIRAKGMRWLIQKRRMPLSRMDSRSSWSWNDQNKTHYTGTVYTAHTVPLRDSGDKLPFILAITSKRKRKKFFNNTYEAYIYASLVIGEMIEGLEK